MNLITQDRASLRAYNKTAIMRILLSNDQIYRAEIARLTGLSIPTVMKITNEFIENGLITEVGKGVSSGGKPPEMLQLLPNSRFFVGVDTRGVEYRCAIMNMRGEILFRHHLSAQELHTAKQLRRAASADQPSVPSENPSTEKQEERGGRFAQFVIRLISQLLDRSGLDRSRIVGIGIGVPYPVNIKTGRIVSMRDLDLENFDLITPVHEAFNMPVFLENTSKTIALAEKWFGEAVNEQNFAVVTIGHGIGSAIFIANEIYSGTNSASGELGHMSIDPNGPLCRCGNHGCLEAMASVTALEQTVRTLLKTGMPSILSSADLSTVRICEAAHQNDVLALTALDQMTDTLAIGITNFVNLMDINLVLLSGGIVELYPEICSQISEKVAQRRQSYFHDWSVAIKPLQIGPDAAMIGAATMLLKQIVDGGNL